MHKESHLEFLRQSRLHWENTNEKFDFGQVEFHQGGGVRKKTFTVCRKKFSRSGTPKIDDFGLFFKNRCPKFLPTRKKRVFRVADFSEKSRKWGFILEGAPQNFFAQTD